MLPSDPIFENVLERLTICLTCGLLIQTSPTSAHAMPYLYSKPSLVNCPQLTPHAPTDPHRPLYYLISCPSLFYKDWVYVGQSIFTFLKHLHDNINALELPLNTYIFPHFFWFCCEIGRKLKKLN